MANHKIKVPVLISDKLENPVDSYAEMVDAAKALIDSYNNGGPEDKTVIKYRNKLRYKVIHNVNYDIYPFDRNINAILLRVEEYKLGNTDMYLQPNGRAVQEIMSSDRLGTNCNYALMYPLLSNDANGQPENRWVTFIYDDPSKDDADLHNTIKTVLTKILKFNVISVFRDRLDNLSNDVIAKLSINYVTKANLGNDEVELNEYSTSIKEKKQRDVVYENIPVAEAMTLIRNYDLNGYDKKTVTAMVSDGLKYKYIYEAGDNEDAFLSSIEETNCYSIELESDEDILNMHQPENVKRNLQGIINRFLTDD